MVVGFHDEQSIYSFAAPLALVWGGILRMRRSAIFQKFRCVCGMIVTLLVRQRDTQKRIPKITLVLAHSVICAVYDIAYTTMLLVGGS